VRFPGKVTTDSYTPAAGATQAKLLGRTRLVGWLAHRLPLSRMKIDRFEAQAQAHCCGFRSWSWDLFVGLEGGGEKNLLKDLAVQRKDLECPLLFIVYYFHQHEKECVHIYIYIERLKPDTICCRFFLN
jgi:hypothetical protein